MKGYSSFRLDSSAVVSLNGDGAIVAWPEEAQRLTGFEATDVTGQHWTCLFPNTHPPSADLLARARQMRMAQFEGWLTRPGGNDYWGRVYLSVSGTPAETDSGFYLYLEDLTEEKRLEHRLHEQQRLLLSIMDNAIDAVITIDFRGIVNSFNRGAEKLFGYRASEVIGKNVRMLMPAPYAAEHDQYLFRYQQTGQARIIGIGREVLAQRRDGSCFPADLAVSEFDDGRRKFVGILRDITERKHLQTEVLRAADEEQQRIGQELHDGVQQQLSGLAMIASHAASQLQTLAEGNPALTKVHSHVQRLVEGIQQANHHVHLLSRGLIPVEVGAQGLYQALDQLAKQVSELHEISCSVRLESPIEVGDRFAATHLFRIAQEAVQNAVKHAQASQIEIVLGQDATHIRLEVRDDGVGVGELPAVPTGRGLGIMGYRARLIGAVFQVGPAVERGTRVVCALPVTCASSQTTPDQSA